jgi:hypothetical protein
MSDSEVHNPDVHHEGSDVNVRAILGFAAGLLIVGVAIHLLVWGLFRYFEGREERRVITAYPLAAGGGMRLPPEPRLQTNPRQDLRDLRTREDELLNSYNWVDKDAGIVRIPISEAMRLVVERGFPVQESKP